MDSSAKSRFPAADFSSLRTCAHGTGIEVHGVRDQTCNKIRAQRYFGDGIQMGTEGGIQRSIHVEDGYRGT